MDAQDRAAFGVEVDRLREAGIGLDSTTRALWTVLQVADVVGTIAMIGGSIAVGSLCFSLLFGPLRLVGLFGGMVMAFAFATGGRRRVLRALYRRLVQRLDHPQLGAVGGTTSAALPASFFAAKPKPALTTSSAYPTIVRPQRVGDDDALDFDDND